MKFNSLGSKIASGYAFALLLLIAVIAVTLVNMFAIENRSEEAFNIDAPISYQSQRVQVEVNRSLAALRGWITLGEDKFKQEFDLSWQAIDDANRQLSTLVATINEPEFNQNFKQLQSNLIQLEQFQQSVADIAQTPDNFPGLQLFIREAAPRAKRINAASTEIIELAMFAPNDQAHKDLFKQLADFRGNFANALASLRAYLLAPNTDFKNEFDQRWSISEKSFLYIQQHEGLLTLEQQRSFNVLSRNRAQLEPLISQLFTLRNSAEWDIAKKNMALYIVPLEQVIRTDIERMVNAKQTALANSLVGIQQSYSELTSISILLLLVASISLFALTVYLTRLVTRPINRVVELADRIGQGNFKVVADLRGSFEIEQLSITLKKMISVFERVATHANTVAQGDYKQDFTPQGEEDQLGNAIKQMTISLRDANKHSNDQDWLKTGQAGLNDCLRGNSNVASICKDSLNYLVKYLDAKVATLYLLQDNKLKLVTSFAYQTRHNSETEFALGEGMVGQVALERSAIIFNDVPDEHLVLTINSGLGDSAAHSVLVFPLINKQTASSDVVGVVALGSNRQFGSLHIELIDKIADSIAIAIESANSQTKVQALLEESRQQAEELLAQQEELTTSNQELEEQARSLRQTEEELRSQGESLQQTNQALEDKTQKLEEQKQDIQHKNQVVEEASRELELRAKELELASKYKSEFLANMSHELRTPLNSLLILSQVLAKNSQGNLSEEQIKDIQIIHSGGESLLALINDILDLSKVEAGKLKLNLETLKIHNIIDSMQRMFSQTAKNKGIGLTLSCASNIPDTIYVDGQRLEQILRNLLSNAIKFTEKGQVELSVTAAPDGFSFKNKALQSSQILAFTIKDSGIGIPQSQQKSIFEAFQQGDGSTNRKFGGTGLGLTISRELSRLLNAEIHLTSEEGKGSVFTLFIPAQGNDNELAQNDNKLTLDNSRQSEAPTDLPLLQQPTQIPTRVSPSYPAEFLPDDRASISHSDKLLLIVEDDKAFASSVLKFAQSRGFKCLVTDKGRDALEWVMHYPPSAIILDLGLTDMNGLHVLEALKASPMTKEIPVHIISALDADEESIKKGAMGFLTKPVDLDALDDMLTKFDAFANGHVKQILLIEDDESSSHSIRRFLEEKDIQITIAHNGQTGLELIDNQKFDCIVLDLNLPDMTGQEWLTKVSQHHKTVPPVIVYTGQELSEEEYKNLMKYSDSIVIKALESPERLHNEVALFLHQINNTQEESNDQHTMQNLVDIFKGKCVLVVDDDLRNSYALSKALEEYGMEIIIADNGELAIEKLAEEKHVDLILMDIMMPVMDGYEAIKHIRGQYHDQHPIIALTAKAMPEDREHCIQAGANDYLAKPVDINQLVSMVKVWLYH